MVSHLYKYSESEARSNDGNWSYYAYAGLPMLMAALQAFLVEFEFLIPANPTKPVDVASIEFPLKYNITGSLLVDLNDLIELRNEVIHPANAPTGTADNWPKYLARVKDLGLLNSTGQTDSDYVLLAQIASHRLFKWAIDVVRSLYLAVIESDPLRAPLFRPYLTSFDPPWF